ncbi:MAG: hypothetical protein ACJAW3_000254 [Lentimonas sp.]|jgi:hypothetical protein
MKNLCKSFLSNFLSKAKSSFHLANKGKENLNIVFWIWGVGAYIGAFFISKLITSLDLKILTWVISILVITYFVWHITIIIKCSPKKQKLNKEERTSLKKDRYNRWGRKLFLKEPLTKFKASTMVISINILAIISFVEHLVS